MVLHVVWPKYCGEMDCSAALATDGASFMFMLVLMRRVHVLLERPPWTAQKPPKRPCTGVKYIVSLALVFLHIAFGLVKMLMDDVAITPSEAIGTTIRSFMWTSYAVLLARNPHLGETFLVRGGVVLHGTLAILLVSRHDTSTISSCLMCFIGVFSVLLGFLVLLPSSSSHHAFDGTFSPLDRSGVLSRLLYTWVSPFIALGLRRRFELTDVPPLPAADRTASHTFQMALLQERRQPHPSFLRLAARLYGYEVVGFGLWSATNKLLSLTSPFLIKEFLDWSSSSSQTSRSSSSSSTTGFVLAGLIGLQAVLAAFSGSQYGLAWARFDLRVRGGLMSAIYGRTLELTLAERSAIGMGKLTNYISVDVGRVVGMPGGVFDMVLIPVEIVVALILLSREVSYAFVAGLVVLGVMLPLQTWLGNQLQSITRNMLQFRDDRVELSSEAIKSIRVLKLLGWMDYFVGKMAASRQLEMGQLGARKYLDALCVVFWASTPVVVQSAVFVAVIYSGHDLTAANAFVAIALLDRLIYPMNYFPWIINGFLEARVSALRLRSFLFAPVVSSSAATRQASVSLWHQCTFAWTPNPSAPNEGDGDGEEDAAANPTTALLTCGGDDVVESRPAASFECHLEHFQLDPTHMHVLVGASGSGKSSMLLAMLGEMPMVHGRHIGPPRLTSYAPQVPWLFAATIRYNITLDADDKSTSSDLYRRVLAACALEQDLACHPLGDLTVLSDHGANLSGGQRARLGLARALYQRADVYLLDDVMGSLDVATAAHVLRSAPAVLPPAASVVLATHAVHLLEHIARPYSILVLEHGRVVEVGSYAELTCRESTRFRTMLQVASGVVRSTSEGNVDKDGNGQTSSSSQRETVSPPDQSSNTPDEEHRDDGVVAAWMWWQYLRSMGVCVLGMLALSVLVMQVSRNGLDYWIASYTSSSVHHPISPPSFARGLVVITAINIVAVTARSFLFAYGGLRAANALYRRLVHRLVRAPLTFYDITPVGRILNRLGGDTYGVDESLPFVLNIFLKDAADVCGTLVILVLTTPAVFLVLGPLTIVYFALQQWYRPTSRHLRRLDAVAQSPLVMMFQATLDGLPILRGLKCEPQWFRVYLHRLHQAQRVSFLASGAGAWFGLRLDSLGVAVTTFVAGYAAVQCYVGRPIPSGVLGLTLIYALPIVGKCNAILSSFIATEQNMVSVERVLEYASVPVEEEDDGSARGGAAASWTDTATVDGQTTRNDHLVNWPPLGHVTLTNVSVRYGADAMRGLPAALHGVTCHIMAKEKVGICGRTGAGKSTLLQCLFRAVPFGGRIVIDGIDIASMSLTRLRASLCFVPQDAVLFKGSIRANVDPMDSLTDAAIWTALAQCCLKDVVEAFPLGLMEPLLQGGDQGRLSRGQAQLLCICRALLRKSKVVCVDEATASIDHGTEQLVQSTMAQAFKDSTVLTVAHRLHTILDSDRVLVLDEGKVVEFDSPKTLRSIPNGYFAALVDGHSASSSSSS